MSSLYYCPYCEIRTYWGCMIHTVYLCDKCEFFTDKSETMEEHKKKHDIYYTIFSQPLVHKK